ncbi:hypothetical protein LTR12_013277 [Friedmanniomyces endolithicus]|nr:hypothetical protein LTR12_013277 [Friedmanniomyces endolithicus]
MTQNWNGWVQKAISANFQRTRHLHTGSHNRGSRGYRILILFGSLVLEFMRKRPIFARDARRNTIDVADAVWFAASPQETEQAAPIKFAMSSLQFGSQCRGSRSLQTSLPSFPAKVHEETTQLCERCKPARRTTIAPSQYPSGPPPSQPRIVVVSMLADRAECRRLREVGGREPLPEASSRLCHRSSEWCMT